MPGVTKIISFLAKAIVEQWGAERANELVPLITEYRSAPPGETQNLDMEVIKTVGEVTNVEEIRGRAELAICDALPDVLEKLDDKNQAPPKVAEELLALTSKKQGTYILWCDVQGGWCYCHFSWSWNDNKRQTAFRIRDYLHGKLYVGVTAYTEGGKWSIERSKLPSALQVWHASKRRIRCRGVLEAGLEEVEKWKKTLDELTRSVDPRLR
jgi:hypothetical protein